jgi:signal transduction histidine kinase
MSTRIPVEAALLERLQWLIRLRWGAAAGVAVVVYAATAWLGLPVRAGPLYLVALLTGAYNAACQWHLATRQGQAVPIDWPRRGANRFAHLQITLDWVALTVLLHLSGGLQNPFVFYFVFHAILASLLLSRKASFIHATLATALVATVGVLESRGLISHVALPGFEPAVSDHPLRLDGMLFVFASTMYIAVYLTTEIVGTLRAREGELAAVKEDLEEANARLREQDWFKSEYVVKVTHSLRSPASAAQSLVGLILDGLAGEVPEQVRSLLERIDRRLGGLLHLVNDLFALSRIKAARTLRLAPLDISDLVPAATADRCVRTGDRGVRLEVAIPDGLPLVEGDQDHLELALINLLTNAVEYTPAGGTVTVTAQTCGEYVEIQISDTGIGIAAEDRPHLFEEFYRGENAKEMVREGTGLGLALVRHIVDRHGGRIDVDSELGCGTTVTLALPRWRGPD